MNFLVPEVFCVAWPVPRRVSVNKSKLKYIKTINMANSNKRSKQTLLSFKKLKTNESLETLADQDQGSEAHDNEPSSSKKFSMSMSFK